MPEPGTSSVEALPGRRGRGRASRAHRPPGRTRRGPTRPPPGSGVLVFASALLAAGIFGPPAAAQEPDADDRPQADSLSEETGRLTGRVTGLRDGRPLGSALVTIRALGIGARVAPDGRFLFRSLAPGTHYVRVRYLGRESGPVAVEIPPGRTVEAVVRMQTEPIRLPGLEVEVRRSPELGKMSGFDRRRERHPVGTFITREEIEERSPHRVSDLLRSVPGMRVSGPTGGVGLGRVRSARAPRIPGRRECRIHYYLDGSRIPRSSGFRIDELSPVEIEGIEIYKGISQVPIEFRRAGQVCGVIVVWTRDPKRAAGR